VFLFIFFAFLF
jgi:cortactin